MRVAVLGVLALAGGCVRSTDDRRPLLVFDRSEPFFLTELLTEAFAGSATPSVLATFRVLDGQGEPVPFSLLHLAWEEGGTLAFQTDEEAELEVRFERATLLGEATVWVRTLPQGHEFSDEREASWQPLAAGRVQVSVRAGV